jgi:hypothetical protein
MSQTGRPAKPRETLRAGSSLHVDQRLCFEHANGRRPRSRSGRRHIAAGSVLEHRPSPHHHHSGALHEGRVTCPNLGLSSAVRPASAGPDTDVRFQPHHRGTDRRA